MKNFLTIGTVVIIVIVIFFTISRGVRSADLLSLGDESLSSNSTFKYIRPITWPPKTSTVAKSFECIPGGEEFSHSGYVSEEVIQGETYCITKVSEKAAGHLYTKYVFARALGSDTQTSTFSVGRDVCENYFPAKREDCKDEQENFSPNALVIAPHSFGEDMKLCYFYSAKTPDGFYDRGWIKMNFSGNEVDGELWLLPGGENSKKGTFTGSVGSVNADGTRGAAGTWRTFSDGKRGMEEIAFDFTYKGAVLEDPYLPHWVFEELDCDRLDQKPVVEEQSKALGRF